jgi:hypothetical protein
MARRRYYPRTRTRYVKKYVRSRHRSSGGFKPIIDGLIAGMGGQFASKYIGIYGHPAVSIGVGMFRNNQVLKTEGARELGAAIASQLPVIGGSSPYGGVY